MNLNLPIYRVFTPQQNGPAECVCRMKKKKKKNEEEEEQYHLREFKVFV